MSTRLERSLLEAVAAPGVATAWAELVHREGRTPFELPAWLLPWLRHYGHGWRPFLLTWRRAGALVAVAPLAWRRQRHGGIPVRELTFWGRTGTPLQGRVGLVVGAKDRDEVSADLGRWLASAEPAWDVFDLLHVAPDSPARAALGRVPRAWHVGLTRVLHSREFVLTLPSQAGPDWEGPMGSKARHEVRRQGRLFARRMGGRFEVVRDPSAAESLVGALRELGSARWGEAEAYFRRDPSFAGFLVSALTSLLESGAARAYVARDERGIQACLVTLLMPPRAVALLIGVTAEPDYARLSLGKCLFEQAIRDAAQEGCDAFDFLTEGGYKEAFWRAVGRPLESELVARGPVGLALATVVSARRVLPAFIGDVRAGRRGDRYRA